MGNQPGVGRVITGRDPDGNVTIVSDGPAPATVEQPQAPGSALIDRWRDESLPPDVTGTRDPTIGDFELMPAGTLFGVIDLARSDAEPLWHETSSIDVVYVTSGRCSLLSASGEITLDVGDSIVVGADPHAWVNHDEDVCRLIDVSVGVPEPSEVTPAWPDPPLID